MYFCVLSLIFIPGTRLLFFAGRQPLLRSRPLQQRCFAVADRAANLDEGRPVAGHPRLGQKGLADPPEPGRFLARQKPGRRQSRRLLRSTSALGWKLHLRFFLFFGSGSERRAVACLDEENWSLSHNGKTRSAARGDLTFTGTEAPFATFKAASARLYAI
jgi:hypothetical protein